MRRSIPSTSGSGGDRATTPGVGDDPRDTLPEPQPPAIAPADFTRTIPMGSAATSEWLANQVGNSHQSGVHSLNEPPPPTTKSDRVPSHRSAQATLANFGSAPPPRIDTDDKRWIGSHVDHGFHTTQRSFSVAPPPSGAASSTPPPSGAASSTPPPSGAASSTPPPSGAASQPTVTSGKTLQMSVSALGPESFGSTLRAMSVPPPAQTAVPKPVSSNPPPPIKPAPMISISPEISVPGRSAEPPPAQTPAQPPPLPKASSHGAVPSAQARPAVDPASGASPELKPASKAPIASKPALERLPGGISTRWLAIGLGIAVIAITTIVALTRPSAPEAQHVVTPAPTATPATPTQADLRPLTEIITNPPGAEIILRGALVANTPARVTRPSYESLYLVRLRGHQPQLVSLSPHSPDTIRIDLQPMVSSTTTELGPDNIAPLPAGESRP